MKTAVFSGSSHGSVGGGDDGDCGVAPSLTFTPPASLAVRSAGGCVNSSGGGNTGHGERTGSINSTILADHFHHYHHQRRSAAAAAAAAITAASERGSNNSDHAAVKPLPTAMATSTSGAVHTGSSFGSSIGFGLSINAPCGFRPHTRRTSRMTNVSFFLYSKS